MTLSQTICPDCITLHAGKKEHSLLTQVFEKTETELKHEQEFLKCKSPIHIATINIRALNRIDQLSELTESVLEHNIDKICRQEHIYHHSELEIKYHDTGSGLTFISTSACQNYVNAATGGNPRTLKSLKSIEKIQPRMMGATFNGNPSTTIISCNNPTNASGEKDLDTFYNELSFLVRSIAKHNVLIIRGDINAQIGKKGKLQIQLTQLVKQKWGIPDFS